MGQQKDRSSTTPQHVPGVPRNAEEQLPPPQHASHPVASVEFEAVTADAPARGSGAAFFEGTMRPTLEAYRDSLRHFRMNAHAPLSAEAERVVRERWGAWFEDLGYE